MGATVLHGVDATEMKSHAHLKLNRFDRIVFNFPHAGFTGHETQQHIIEYARTLALAVLWFLSLQISSLEFHQVPIPGATSY